jgi:hypothetical protein
MLRRSLVFALVCLAPAGVFGQSARSLPAQLTDKEFWELFTSMSEDGGSFPSENFISNEMTYQYPIPYLQHVVRTRDVYLGVGPEQNFTYIANLKPRMAIVFDIRRQNALAHLMYKALFELSPTRAEFVSRLFSRTLTPVPRPDVTAAELFAAVAAVTPKDSLFEANLQSILNQLTRTHRFVLDSNDVRVIRHVYSTFVEAGPDINYGYRPGSVARFTAYPTLGELQTLVNASGENMAFLADESRYETVRALELKNLIVPVVGDFAGQKAIRSVGAWLTDRHANVGAFYLSNVEQYLFRQEGSSNAFYSNVATLPTDSTSMFIRSVPPQYPLGGYSGLFSSAPPATPAYYSVQFSDSGNASIVVVTRDSAGQRTTTRTIDSSAARPRSALQVFRSLQRPPASAAGAPLARVAVSTNLVSGVAPILATLGAFRAARLTTYYEAIAMTKVDGWR